MRIQREIQQQYFHDIATSIHRFFFNDMLCRLILLEFYPMEKASMSVRIVLPLWLQRGVCKKRLLALIDSSRDKLHHPTPAVNLPPNA